MYCLRSFLIFVIEPLKTFTNETLNYFKICKTVNHFKRLNTKTDKFIENKLIFFKELRITWINNSPFMLFYVDQLTQLS